MALCPLELSYDAHLLPHHARHRRHRLDREKYNPQEGSLKAFVLMGTAAARLSRKLGRCRDYREIYAQDSRMTFY